MHLCLRRPPRQHPCQGWWLDAVAGASVASCQMWMYGVCPAAAVVAVAVVVVVAAAADVAEAADSADAAGIAIA